MMVAKIIRSINNSLLSPKKEFSKAILVSSLFIGLIVASVVLRWPSIYIGYSFGGLVLFNFFYFARYDIIASKIRSGLEMEFVRVFTYFGIYIRNGYNVYQSLLKIKDYSNSQLKVLLDKLTDEIEDNKSITPFVNFGENFDNVSIRELMLSIYQMVDEGGGGNYITQYEVLFESFSIKKHKVEEEERKNKLSTLTILPLIGSGIIMVVLTLSLVQIMGGYLSVV